MTEEQAENAATVLIGAAAVGVAFFILKTPRLRRMVWQLARTAVAPTASAWLLTEVRRGWNGNGAAQDVASAGVDPPDRQPAI
jgi:apolipoprotein N-acyltransferase